ncbi:hypothetical protein Leryth_025282 [Lithospermum erythrorhizon]|nr:hypothetical protein Leryth_025282 [Lithospermum erythrorhizon]
MASTVIVEKETKLVKVVCGIIVKGKWDNVLRLKMTSLSTPSVISQILLKLSPFSVVITREFFDWVEFVPNYKHSLYSNWTMICILTKYKHFKIAHSMVESIAFKDFLSTPSVLNAVVDVSYGSEVNSHVLSWLVIVYAKSKMTHDAIQVFEHMRVWGYKPHLHACTVLLNSLVKERLTDTVWKIFKRMMKDGVVPNLHIYNVMLHACCKSGDVDKAEELFSDMEFNGIDPDLITYNTLISLYCKKATVGNVE